MADFNLKDIGEVFNSAKDSVEQSDDLIKVWKYVGFASLIVLFFTWNKFLK